MKQKLLHLIFKTHYCPYMNPVRCVLAVLWLLGINVSGQTVITLQDAVRIANDSSLSAFRSRNLYLAGYWEYS